jgi:hypothetical protein
MSTSTKNSGKNPKKCQEKKQPVPPIAVSDPEVVDLRLLGVSRIAEKDHSVYQ